MTAEERAQALAHTIGTDGWQKVIKPALTAAIADATKQWLDGKADVEQGRRVAGMMWLAEWEQRCAVIAEQLEAMAEMRRQTLPASEGGSIYDG